MNLTDPANISLTGDFQDRIVRARDHLLALNTPEMRKEFTAPDAFWHWGADYLGRWIAAAGYLERYFQQEFGVSSVVDELIRYQEEDGSFGPYTDPHDFQEWFGMGRGLIGLVEYYRMSGADHVLSSALRLGDYFVQHYPDNADTLYECYSSGLEGMVALAELSGENKYLDCARRMAATSAVFLSIRYSTDMAPNGRRSPHAGQVHCQLSTARGLLDLHQRTGEAQYLEPVIRLHTYICSELLWASGGIGFYYFRPEENETCADADWLRLNLQLWQITGDNQYIDLAERILFNQLFFNQADNGGFCYLRGLENRAGAVFDACCSHHGPRAFYETLRYIYTTAENQVWVNLYVEGQASLPVGAGKIRFTAQQSHKPGGMHIHYEIEEAPAQAIRFLLRIPKWIDRAEVRINGVQQSGLIPSGYQPVERVWQCGDRIEVIFHLSVRLLPGNMIGKHRLAQDEVCVWYGPRLFSINDHENPTVRLFLFQLDVNSNRALPFRVLAPERIEAMGSTPENENAMVIFTPLANTGGSPSGAGRIHTMRSPYYKTCIPVKPQKSYVKEEAL